MSISQHVRELLTLAAILLGPLPWAAIVALPHDRSRAGPGHAALCLLVVWTLFDTAIALALGALGRLDVPAIVTAELTLGVAGLMLARSHIGLRARGAGKPCGLPFGPIEQLLMTTLLAIGATLLVKLARTPIIDFDSLLYHLTAVAEYYQNRSFVDLAPAGGGLGFIGRYPFGWEALSTLFVVPFGEDFLVALPNLLAAIVLGLSTYLLSVTLGTGRVSALTAVVLLLSVPVVTQVVLTLHVDLALAAFFGAGLYFVAVVSRSQASVDVALLLAALGLVCGVKTSGIVYAGMLLLVACLVCVSRSVPRERRPRSQAERVATILVAAAAVWVAGFWYTKNFLEVGNPLGDIEVKVGNSVVFPGRLAANQIVPTTLFSSFDVRSLKDWAVVLRVVRPNLSFAFAALVVLAAGCGRRRTDAHTGPSWGVRLGLIAVLTATFAIYVLTPFSARHLHLERFTPYFREGLRFAIPFMGTLAIAAAVGGSTIARLSRTVAIVAVVIAIQSSSGWTKHGFVPSIAVGWGAWRLGRYFPAGVRGRTALAAAVFALFVAVAGSFRLRAGRVEQRLRQYGAVTTFVDTRVRGDEVIGNFLDRQPYLLYGRALDRRVVWVPFAADGLDTWIAELRRRRVHWLAVGPLTPRWRRQPQPPRELVWINDNRELFVPTYGHDRNEETVFYRVADEEPTRARDSLPDHGHSAPRRSDDPASTN